MPSLKISYKKLWKILVDREMSKIDLRERCKIGTGTMTKLNKGVPVSVETLLKICECLGCNIGDICDAEKVKEKRGDGDG